MPTYEYACSKCGHEFELFQSMKDDALTSCPKEKCVKPRWGKGKVKRLLGTGAGLIFKGSGFYTTDYRSENYKAGAKSDTPASASTAAPASTPGSTASPSPATATAAGSSSSPASAKSGPPAKSAGSGSAPSKPSKS